MIEIIGAIMMIIRSVTIISSSSSIIIVIRFIPINNKSVSLFYYLRELAPLLTPEDPSHEAYWVANGNRRQAGTR